MKTPRPLPDLLKAFDDRHKWWERVITLAKKNHADRKTEADAADAELNYAETGATGFQRIFDRLQRHRLGGTQPDLRTLYKKYDVFEATILNPLDGLDMIGAVSQRRPQFWQDYANLLAQKDFTAAERHLNRATNWWQKTKIYLGGGGHFAFKEWTDEIEKARKYLPHYMMACDNINQIEDSIDEAQDAVGKALYKILNDKKVQRMLSLPAMATLAQQRPEFGFLAHYTGRTSVARGEIIDHLKSMRGTFHLETLMRAASEIAQKSPATVERLRKESDLAKAREQAAHQFIESANTTKRLELNTCYIVNRANPLLSMSRDLSNDLKNAAHLSQDEEQSLREVAEEKMKRWINPAKVEYNLDKMKRADFSPKELYASPWSGYIVNAGLQSTKRAVWDLPVKTLSATTAFIGTQLKQAWDHARNHFTPSQPPPLPLSPPPLQHPLQQPQQPQQPPSRTP